MMMVRCILVETTVPVRIRPRIETRPVKGHFLSIGEVVVSRGFDHAILDRLFVHNSPWRPVLRASHSQSACLLLSPTFAVKPRSSSNVFKTRREKFEVFRRTDVLALNGVLGGTETQTDILVPSALFQLVSSPSRTSFFLPRDGQFVPGNTHATLARTLGLALGDKRNVRLLLESTLRLDRQLGSHVCGCGIVGRKERAMGLTGLSTRLVVNFVNFGELDLKLDLDAALRDPGRRGGRHSQVDRRAAGRLRFEEESTTAARNSVWWEEKRERETATHSANQTCGKRLDLHNRGSVEWLVCLPNSLGGARWEEGSLSRTPAPAAVAPACTSCPMPIGKVLT